MTSVSVGKAKTTFSQLLQRVAAGEEIVISNRGVPVARLVPFPQQPKGPRPLGIDNGRAHISDDFDAPLPPDILAGFFGKPAKRKKRR
jgi:prevent-host-death family protein